MTSSWNCHRILFYITKFKTPQPILPMNPNSDKSRISLISVSILHSIMEVICNRFPMIARNILNKLDNITLLNCKKSSRELNTFLEKEKTIRLRIVGNIIGFEKSWKQTIEKNSVDNIKQLALATQKFFKTHWRFCDQWHPLLLLKVLLNFVDT